MMMPIPTRPPRPSEEGYVLVAVIFMLAILIIVLAIAAPAVKTELTRDREIETMQRGKQYIRAVQLYYRKFGRYPPNVDALVKPTNGIRFLRKKYIDPTTGKEEWRPIQFGQVKTQTPGFFGKPLGMTGSGLGGDAGASNIGAPVGSSSGFGSTSTGFGASAGGFGTPTSGFGSTPTGTGSDPSNPTGTTGGIGSGSNPISGGASPGTSAFGGQTFGGAGIVGFAPTSPKQSLLVYRKKNHYNEWEFVYDPLADRKTVGGSSGPSGSRPAAGISSGIGGTPVTPPTTPLGGSSPSPALPTQ